jgi:hypothetical protein
LGLTPQKNKKKKTKKKEKQSNKLDVSFIWLSLSSVAG